MDSYFLLLNLSFIENCHISVCTTFAKQSMINRLSNAINRNRSATKISKVMSSSCVTQDQKAQCFTKAKYWIRVRAKCINMIWPPRGPWSDSASTRRNPCSQNIYMIWLNADPSSQNIAKHFAGIRFHFIDGAHTSDSMTLTSVSKQINISSDFGHKGIFYHL